jgi:hypothetical protein
MESYKSFASIAFSAVCISAMMAGSFREPDVPVGKNIQSMRRMETAITFTVTPTGSVTKLGE